MRFKANSTAPTKVIATFYKNGAELGRGRAVSGAPVDDVTTYNLTVLTPLALDAHFCGALPRQRVGPRDRDRRTGQEALSDISSRGA